jgi:hypothetical protein
MPPLVLPVEAQSSAQTDGDAATTAPTAPPSPTPEGPAAPAPERARDADPSSPPAAKPVLASTILSNLLGQHHGHQQYRNSCGMGKGGGNEAERMNRVRSGLGELVDFVLLGGVDWGAVVGFSGVVVGGGGGVGRLVSFDSHFVFC